jgi:hypothetical protein
MSQPIARMPTLSNGLSSLGQRGSCSWRSPDLADLAAQPAGRLGGETSISLAGSVTGHRSRYGLGKGPCQPTVESTVLAVDEILKSVALTVKSSIAAASKMVSSSPDRARCH